MSFIREVLIIPKDKDGDITDGELTDGELNDGESNDGENLLSIKIKTIFIL